MNKTEIIAALGLEGHFEGGYFRAMFRATEREPFATANGPRLSMTSIYYILTDDSPIDVFHTKLSDGIEYHHFGAPVTYHLIHPDGRYEAVVLGHAVEDIDGAPAHEPEVPRVRRDLDVDQSVENAIERVRRGLLEVGFTLAFDALAEACPLGLQHTQLCGVNTQQVLALST